jgi:hypothetical protein
VYFVYFFLVLSNILLGGVLIADRFKEKNEIFQKLTEFAEVGLVRVILSGLGVFAGFFGLIITINEVTIIGNLIPALSSIAMGMLYYFHHQNLKNPDSESHLPALEGILLGNRFPIGIVGMVAGLVHMINPQIPFL